MRLIAARGDRLTGGGDIDATLNLERAGTIEARFGDVMQPVTIVNAAGGNGNALHAFRIPDGTLQAPLTVQAGGNAGRWRIHDIEADVQIGGALGELVTDNNIHPQAGRFTVDIGGRGRVKGSNRTVDVDEGGGMVYIV